MAEPAEALMDVETFLASEARAERRHELVAGRPQMMTGGTSLHGDILGGAASSLRRRLGDGPCRARIAFKVICPNGNVRCPDVMVDCGPTGPRDLAAAAPMLLIEVVSPASQATDYFSKLRDYDGIASVSAYLIFSQDAVTATVFRRDAAGRLDLDGQVIGRDATIDLPELKIVLPLAEVYEGLDLPEY